MRHEGVFVSTPVGNDPIQASRADMDSIVKITLLSDPLITLATYDLGHVMATDCNAAYARTRMRVPIMKPIYGQIEGSICDSQQVTQVPSAPSMRPRIYISSFVKPIMMVVVPVMTSMRGGYEG